jgi:iron complex outermembrane receptor protein
VLSGRFDNGNYPALGNMLLNMGVASAQFFVNSIDTRTQGLDLTVSNKSDVMGGKLNTFLAMNFSATDVTNIKAPPSLKGFEEVLLSERERLFIEQGGPRRKATLAFEYTLGKVGTDFKIIHFGPQSLGTFSGPPTPPMHYEAKTSADLGFTYSFTPKTKFTVGAANIFNVKPTAHDPNETDNGFKYESVQFGLNGTSYFARLWHKF